MENLGHICCTCTKKYKRKKCNKNMSLNMHYSLHLWRDLPSSSSKHSDQVTVHSCRESEGDGGGDEEDSLCYALSV